MKSEADFEERLLENTQDLIEKDNPDEILAKLASTLMEQGCFPQVQVSLFDRAYSPELVERATVICEATLALNLPEKNERKPRRSKASSLSIPLQVRDQLLGQATLSLNGVTPALSEAELKYFRSLVNIAGIAIDRARDCLRLKELAIRDELTGCYNRRYFFEVLHQKMAAAKRYHRAFSLIMADLDGLKHINDAYGHLAGDAVLQKFGEVVRGQLRTSDVACRYGGDEFALLLPETTKAQATVLIQRLKKVVGRQRVKVNHKRLKVGFSCGIASFPEDDNLIETADHACYQDKLHASPNKSLRTE